VKVIFTLNLLFNSCSRKPTKPTILKIISKKFEI
jgi:hypothetical protein